jgi:tagatose 6-phosphate kinase
MIDTVKPAILVVCFNPTFQKTLVVDHLWEGEVNRSSEYYLDASGKGMNVARMIAQLGARSVHLTHLGGLRTQEILDLLAQDNIEVLWADSHSPIRTCTTIINREHSTTTELVEEPFPVSPGTEQAMVRLFSESLGQVETIVISGTRAQGYSPSLYPEFVREAKAAGKKIVLDVKGLDLANSLQWGPDVIKPNLSEFAATFLRNAVVKEQADNHEIQDKVCAVMAEIWQEHGVATAITRGSRNLWLYDADGFSELPVHPVKAINTIGCGDAVTAGIAFSLTKGMALRESVLEGLRCGSINAQTIRPGNLISI